MSELNKIIISQSTQSGMALGLCLSAFIELFLNIRSKYVWTRLLPLTIAAFFHTILNIGYLDVAYGNFDPITGGTWILGVTIFRTIYYLIDAFIYIERIRAFFSIWNKTYMNICIGYMITKFILQAIFDLWSGGLYIQLTTLEDSENFLTHNQIFLGTNYLSVLLPAIQALLVDVPILWIIVTNIKRLNKQIEIDNRRLVRIGVLILSSITVTIISIASSFKDLKLPIVSSICIILVMSNLVNIDLYNLDIQLIKNSSSPHATSQTSAKRSNVTSQISAQPRPSITKELMEEPESPAV